MVEKGEMATLGGGCFWCLEAIFSRLDGVLDVLSGYCGGHVADPGYEAVCSGNTGHAEVVQIRFDPELISYDELLEVFFATHDPTSLNRQGNDIGTQYRSVIYTHTEAQKQSAERAIAEAARHWDHPVVTEIAAFEVFYPAEQYHWRYYDRNGNQPYCMFGIAPKLAKFEAKFKEKLKA